MSSQEVERKIQEYLEPYYHLSKEILAAGETNLSEYPFPPDPQNLLNSGAVPTHKAIGGYMVSECDHLGELRSLLFDFAYYRIKEKTDEGVYQLSDSQIRELRQNDYFMGLFANYLYYWLASDFYTDLENQIVDQSRLLGHITQTDQHETLGTPTISNEQRHSNRTFYQRFTKEADRLYPQIDGIFRKTETEGDNCSSNG